MLWSRKSKNLFQAISHISRKTSTQQYFSGHISHTLIFPYNYKFFGGLHFGANRSMFMLKAKELDSIPWNFSKPATLGFCRGSKFVTGFAPLQRKPLDSIISIERAKTLSSDDLISSWDDLHLGRGHISMAIKAQLYQCLNQRSISCRHFVIPLRRGNGYTTMFIQVQMPQMLFTGLEDYKTRGTQSSPYFAVTHYTEFAESKGVVLIRGDVVLPSKLDDLEARWLLEASQIFYLNDAKYKLVERFNKETHEFEFDDVLRALEIPVL